ncbi:hypothetical protein [Chryseobacterium caseinilyticum]|uniref:Uncharacterized protein n=1 Tax=Chryseobacterium caseinilyticum TaxID=2771428 RepID=A0ABR8ZGL1_9FLAO|nr:hypothetical protein [Chryseobacterium caseinilyticum]MBD8084441.1 hypothetical protein [Chryseobacterium caseinilyticum]
MEKEDSATYRHLLRESRGVNYDKLAEKIIADLDKNEISKPNLVVYIEDYYKLKLPVINMEPCMGCCFSRLATNPVFNDYLFWTTKNIKRITEKFKVNVIPKNATFGYFFNDKASEHENSKLIKIYRKTKRQKSGIYSDNSPDNQPFYYFPFNNQENLTLIDQYPDINFNTIKLYFRNEVRNKVFVEYEYDVDNSYKRPVKRVYQYINREWTDITAKEYGEN